MNITSNVQNTLNINRAQNMFKREFTSQKKVELLG